MCWGVIPFLAYTPLTIIIIFNNLWLSISFTCTSSTIGNTLYGVVVGLIIDGYYVAYKPTTLPCILFMFIEIKFIHYHSCMMLATKFMSICTN